MRQHPQQPSVVDGIKEVADVDIEHPVHFPRHQGPIQGRQRRVRAASRTETVAEPEEVDLIDGAQDLGHRALDDLVFERGNAERPPSAFGIVLRSTGFGQYCPLWTLSCRRRRLFSRSCS